MARAVPPRTPVLVGAGARMQREDDHRVALEPIDLMIDSVLAAGQDSGAPDLLAQVDSIAVPRGRWRYRNPAAEIAQTIGATDATTILSSVGVLQQTLVADACEAIADGKSDCAIIVGADAGYRLLRARIAGERASERDQQREPDIRLEPKDELRHPAEVAAGLKMPVGLYAILDSARRAAKGVSVDRHRDELAARYARFSAIASANSNSWNRTPVDSTAIREAAKRNPMQAFPYTRSHCSTWNVDQASALLLCSAEKAEALGIDRRRWLFPVASAESNHMVPVAARADLVGSPGATMTARAVLELGGVAADDIDLVELYSCFPIAVDVFADALALAPGRDLTVTGSMAFAGGPYNNYFLHATVRAAELLRAGQGTNSLLSCVSGILTKQAFALWSVEPPPSGFARRDVSAETAAAAREVPVVQDYAGTGTIAGYTVLYERDSEPRAVALIDTAEGARAFALSHDSAVISAMEREEWVGRPVRVVAGQLAA